MTNIIYNVTASLEIDADENYDWIARGKEKYFPYWNHDGSPLTTQQIIDHVAYNAVTNGVTDISKLEGWGDYPRGAVTFRVSDVEVF